MSAPTSLAQALAPAAVDYETLRARYSAFLQLGRRLLGVEANCYPFMEIWPTCFRTYNLLVPNFFNVPLPFLGIGPSPGLLGTAMYAASRAAECMYCSAHCCTVAQRGGASRETLIAAAEPEQAPTEGERLVMRVARGIASVPPSVTRADLEALERTYSRSTAQWLTHVIAMMGFLNKMMDGMGFDLEKALVEEIQEVASASGWSPGRHTVSPNDRPTFASPKSSARTLLAMVPYMPAAILQDKRWTAGVPGNGAKAAALLESICGYRFEMVERIEQPRIVRTLTTMLRDNLQDTVIGAQLKHAAGLVFAAGLSNAALVQGTRTMASKAGEEALDALEALGREPVNLADPQALDEAMAKVPAGQSPEGGAALVLAKALSTSPAIVTPAVVERSGALSPPQVIELVTWISLLALLHRAEVAQTA